MKPYVLYFLRLMAGVLVIMSLAKIQGISPWLTPFLTGLWGFGFSWYWRRRL